MLIIVSPNNESEPAIWIATTASDVAIETKGSQGFRKRPEEITLVSNNWKIKVVRVHRLYRQWVKKRDTESGHLEEKLQSGREGSLVKELAKAEGVKPRYEIEAAPSITG